MGGSWEGLGAVWGLRPFLLSFDLNTLQIRQNIDLSAGIIEQRDNTDRSDGFGRRRSALLDGFSLFAAHFTRTDNYQRTKSILCGAVVFLTV